MPLDSDIPDDTFDSNSDTLTGVEGLPALQSGPQQFPASVGGFRIIRLLGEGGMGAVYEAEQDRPRRRVALKIVKAGWASPEMLARFEQEFQILGRLHHPGIAQIYEAGTADSGFGSQPFFAMELIKGKRLADYANERRLGPRERLALMIQVCEAVQHAHERGIIHRDLKPGNIMVHENGQPKILDFGLARFTGDDAQATRQTDVGQVVGTLAYMSPEQVSGDPSAIDVRSDVYALGVILYELLAGKRPYELTRHLHEAVQTIQQVDPSRLSAVSRIYRGDVETIVARALEKDKNRRYASAAELSADIRRHLDNQPIVARPASTTYRLQKFVRRHQALVTGTAAVFLVLVVGIVASTREALRARRAEHVASAEAASAKAINEFLQNDLLAQASASNQTGLSVHPDPEIKVRTVLDRAALRIEGKFDKQPEVEAAIRDTIGRTYSQVAEYAQSQKHLERALELERRVWGPESPKTLTTLNALGRTAWQQGKYPQAETLLADAFKIQRRVLGTENADTLFAMNNLANVYRAQGKDAQAAALYSETLELRRRVLGPEHPDTLTSINNLANVYWSQGNYDQAAALYAQAMTVQRRVLGPEHPSTLLSMGNLADTLAKEGKNSEAEPLFIHTVEVSRRVLGPDHPTTAGFLTDFASMYQRQGKYQLAETYAEQVLAARRRVLGAQNSETMESAADLALAYLSEKKFPESERLSGEVLDFNQKKQPDSWQRFRAQSLLGATLAGEKKYAEAEPLLIEGYTGMAERKQRMGWMGIPNWYHVDLAHDWVVQLYRSWGKPEKVAEWQKR